jgi:tryptophanyl-tRNA synthetase
VQTKPSKPAKPLRIMSLSDPTKKMSKTGDEAILMDDSPAEISRKLKKAVTASEAGHKSPGVENLFSLLEHFGNKEEVVFFQDQQKQGNLKFSELKETLAKDIAVYFESFREKKQELLAKPDYLAKILGQGADRARAVASATLIEVKQKIGLL